MFQARFEGVHRSCERVHEEVIGQLSAFGGTHSNWTETYCLKTVSQHMCNIYHHSYVHDNYHGLTAVTVMCNYFCLIHQPLLRAGLVGKKIKSAGGARLQHELFKSVGLGVLGGG